MTLKSAAFRLCAVATMIGIISLPGYSQTAANTTASVRDIERRIHQYFASIDRADTNMAEKIFSSDASFIHPRGEAHARAQIEANVYRDLMGKTFSGDRGQTGRFPLSGTISISNSHQPRVFQSLNKECFSYSHPAALDDTSSRLLQRGIDMQRPGIVFGVAVFAHLFIRNVSSW